MYQLFCLIFKITVKGNEHVGFFNTVTAGTVNSSLRSFGDISKLKGKGGNSGGGGSSNSSFRFKRTFSEMGRVTSQQFIFIGGDDNSRSALGYNNNYNIGDNSNNGSFSRSMSIKNNTTATATNNSNGISNKSGSNNNNNNNTTTVSSFSLFAQINAKK